MKKTISLLCSLFLIIINTADAQSPVLDAANTNPVIGEFFSGSPVLYDDPGNTGANQTWDFRDPNNAPSPPTPGQSRNYMNPSNSGKSAFFPNANIAAYSQELSSYNFYSTQVNDLSLHGFYNLNPENIVSYSDPKKLLQYPFSLGSGFTDTYEGSFTTPLGIVIRKGKVVVEADGYGKLILPLSTHNQVLRVNYSDEYSDSLVGGSSVNRYTNKTINWHSPGIHHPILSLSETYELINGSPVFQSQSGLSLSDPFLGTENIFSRQNAVQVFPNPAKTFLQLMAPCRIKNLFCYNYLGQNQQVEISGNMVNTENLSAGIYLLMFQADSNEILFARFIKE